MLELQHVLGLFFALVISLIAHALVWMFMPTATAIALSAVLFAIATAVHQVSGKLMDAVDYLERRQQIDFEVLARTIVQAQSTKDVELSPVQEQQNLVTWIFSPANSTSLSFSEMVGTNLVRLAFELAIVAGAIWAGIAMRPKADAVVKWISATVG